MPTDPLNAPLTRVPVVIVGGGMAGLATAYELHTRHVPFVLLEAAPRLGGVVYSEIRDGFVLDGGPDALLVQKPDGIALCRELGLEPRLIVTKRPRQAYIQRGGALHPLPAASVLGIPTQWGPFIRTSLFSWLGKLRMGAEWFIPRRTDAAEESVGQFIRRRFGREAVDYLADPLLAGIHASDVEQLSIQAMFPRFPATERQHGSLLRAFRRQPAAPASADGAFKSLPTGLSELVTALRQALPAASLHTGIAVTGVRRVPGGYAVETAAGTGWHASAVIVCTPAFVTADLLREVAPTVALRSAEVPYTSAGTVALAFRRDQVIHPLDGSGFVVPTAEKSGIMAASWLSSKWPHRAPDGSVLLRAFVGGANDPHALDRDDDALVARCLAALRPLLGISGEPLFTRVFRWPRANAQHNVGHLARVAAIDEALRDTPGLYVTGSGYRGVGIPDVVADARATARQVATWLSSHAEGATAVVE